MPASSDVMLLNRTFIKPVGDNPTLNDPRNHDAAREWLLLPMKSETLISEML